MPIGTNDAVLKYGTEIILEASGAQINSGAFGQADDAVLAGGGAPMGALAFEGTFAAAPTAGSSVDVYLQAVGVDAAGTGDANTPSNNFPHIYVGSIPVDATGVSTVATVVITLPDYKDGQTYNVYLKNNTGQNLSATWDLKFTPQAYGPSA